ncbi:MAG TPA: hypothetical protein VIC34_12035 [Croceibacterium sp.]|jgi:hypothetical protein
MKKMMSAALVAASLLALSACHKPAASDTNAGTASGTPSATGIDGTWKADLATVQIDSKPAELMLKDGKYSCSTCTPPLTIAADGAFHAVTGQPYADSISVKVDDDHHVTTTSKKGDKVVGETKLSVSDDGKTLTRDFKDDSGAKTVTGSSTATRVGNAPAGAHAISGSWKLDKYNNVSDEGTTVTYKLDGDTLHMTSPTGQSYDAKIGGPDVPIQGDIGKTMASVTKTGDNAYRETDKQGGKTISTTDFTVDGDVMHVVNHDEHNGSTMKYDAKRS